MTGSAGEAERRRRARARKTQTVPHVAAPGRNGYEPESALADCPDPANHEVCRKSSSGHDWIKPHPRPEDHKYECAECGHYDLDDYK